MSLIQSIRKSDQTDQLMIASSRYKELAEISEAIQVDEDLIVAGVTGSGRQLLVEYAAQKTGFQIVEVDCIQTTSRERLIELFLKGLRSAFCQAEDVQDVLKSFPGRLLPLGKDFGEWELEDLVGQAQGIDNQDEYLFEVAGSLLDLTEVLANHYDQRVVVLIKNFTHLQSWDRDSRWSEAIRGKIDRHEHVSYVLIATFGELHSLTKKTSKKETSPAVSPFPNAKVIELKRLDDSALTAWASMEFQPKGLVLDPLKGGLKRFLDIVQGHFGDALILARRLELLAPQAREDGLPMEMGEGFINEALESILRDFDQVFEALLLLLPATQKRLLECLVLAPTSKPHSLDYIQEHGLPRGGTLQGALKGLEKKGLIYGSEYQYAIAMPLLAQWIRRQHKI